VAQRTQPGDRTGSSWGLANNVIGEGVNTMTALSYEELCSEQIELLPSRETLGLLNWANVSATNVAISQNSLTLLSLAHASANQAVLVSQS
jgi:hypothetical protein